MALDIRNLRYFLGVAAAQSISRAAENLHIAQPALSVQMRQLEEELGTRLLERTPRGVVLTAAGRLLQERAQEILARVDGLYGELRSAGAEPQGQVSIGLPLSVAQLITLELVRTAMARLPKVRLRFFELSTGHVPQSLLKGEIDLGLTFIAPETRSIRGEQLVHEDLVLIGPPGRFSDYAEFHGANACTMRFRDLNGQPMVLPQGAQSLRALLEQLQRKEGITLHPAVEVSSIAQLVELAGAGIGWSILSYASVRAQLRAGQVSVARITDPAITRSVYLCRSAGAQPTMATLAVIDLLQTIVAQMQADDRWPTNSSP